jgi:S1-C subfamily serine protease
VNAFDVFIVALAIAAGIGGHRVGFLGGAASWAGMAAGVLVGTRLLPTVIEHFQGSGDVNLLFMSAAVLVAGAFLGQGAGFLIGSRLHLALPNRTARTADHVAGAVAGVVGVTIAVWLLLPMMSDTPDWPAQQARNSTIARAIHAALPPPPDTLRALRRFIGGDQFPEVFDNLRPAPALEPPPAETGLSAVVAEDVAAATVKVVGTACRTTQEGSGAVIGPDLVVTNAHVVAGERDTVVERYPDGARLTASVVAFDADRDVAILRVPGIDRDPLPLRAPSEDDVGGVFGHPGGGDLRVAPFSIGDVSPVTGTDIYDSKSTEREVLFLAASLMPGDSGAALVVPDGSVVGLAFAVAPDRAGVAYALAASEMRAVLDPVTASGATAAVDTGPCLH